MQGQEGELGKMVLPQCICIEKEKKILVLNNQHCHWSECVKDKSEIDMISTIQSTEILPTGKQARKITKNIIKQLYNIKKKSKSLKGVDRVI